MLNPLPMTFVWRLATVDGSGGGDSQEGVEQGAGAKPWFTDQLRHRLKRIVALVASIGAVGAIVGGMTGYWTAWKTVRSELAHDPQSVQKAAADKPTVAPRLSLVVLPFANLNRDPDQDYFADAITTDLTTDLARMPGAFVIGRGTAFTYKNKQFDLKSLGRDLAIRWAVQGAVQRNGDEVRVNVSLTDLATGGDIWSDRFDGDRSNLGALQDQITARLARSLNVELFNAESRRSETEQPKTPDAADFVMRGWAKLYEPRVKAAVLEAQNLFERALQLDPDNIDAQIGKAYALNLAVWNQYSTSAVADMKLARELVDRALSRRPNSAMGHVVKGDILRFGDPEAAIQEYDFALQIDPNFPPAHGWRGAALITAGRAREALAPLRIALRLSPKDPFVISWHYNLCHAYLHIGEFDAAIAECNTSIDLNANFWWPYSDLVSIYGTTGQIEKAQEKLAELKRIRPGFTVQGYKKLGYSLSSNPKFRREFDDIVEGLRKAGAPEQ